MSALSMKKAADEMKIDRKLLKKLTDSGEIPYWFKTPSGRYMYSLETIEEHKRLAAHRNSKAAS